MIEHLRGSLLHKDPEHVVVEAGGVGYGLDVTARTCERLGAVGSEARLWVYTVVREDALDLYGFASRAERDAFEVFLGISGLGAKLSLAILGSFAVDQLIEIVLRKDAHALKSVPGIGLKRAEKLLLELKGKIDRLSAGLAPGRLAELTAASPSSPASWEPATSAGRDALAALDALGTPAPAARRAIERALELLGPDASTENLVREALRHRHP